MIDDPKTSTGSQDDSSAPEAVLVLTDDNYIYIRVIDDSLMNPPFRIVLEDADGNSAMDVKARPSQVITWLCTQGDFIIRFVDMKDRDGNHTHTTPSQQFTHAGDQGKDLSIKMRQGIPRGAESKYEVYVILDGVGVISLDPRLIWP